MADRNLTKKDWRQTMGGRNKAEMGVVVSQKSDSCVSGNGIEQYEVGKGNLRRIHNDIRELACRCLT